MTSVIKHTTIAGVALAALLLAGPANAASIVPGALNILQGASDNSSAKQNVHYRRHRHSHRQRLHRGPRFYPRARFRRRARLRRRCFNHYRPVYYTYRCHRIRRNVRRRFY